MKKKKEKKKEKKGKKRNGTESLKFGFARFIKYSQVKQTFKKGSLGSQQALKENIIIDFQMRV